MGGDPGARTPGKSKPKADLVRLVYVSFAARDLSPRDLRHIESRSHDNNLAAGITGLLVSQGDFFYVLMEGPRRRVLSRMETVITDDRHRGLRILLEDPITTRRFANWSFARLPDGTIAHRGEASPGHFIIELSRRLA
jgi:hypothetical protein